VVNVSRLGPAVRKARNGWAALVVLVAGTVSAVAAVVDATRWVSVSAAIVAILGGVRVLANDLIVPLRMDEVEAATAMVLVYDVDSSSPVQSGTAFHVGGGGWITAAYVVENAQRAQVRLHGLTSDSHVIHVYEDLNVAVVQVSEVWPRRARLANQKPGSGARLRVIGWAGPRGGRSPRRISFELTAQGALDDGVLLLTGPLPPMGFGGGPAIDSQTGRVVGFVDQRTRSESDQLHETTVRLASEWMGSDRVRSVLGTLRR
jgi:hypothetical protein